jgi:hypothetical protein
LFVSVVTRLWERRQFDPPWPATAVLSQLRADAAKAALSQPTDTMLLGAKTGEQAALTDIALYGNIRKVVARLATVASNDECCSATCTLGWYGT